MIQDLFLSLLFLLTSLISLSLRLLSSSCPLGWVHPVLQLGYLLSKISHDGIPGRKVLFKEFSVSLLQLNLEPSPEHWLLAPFPRVKLPFQNIRLAKDITSIIQHRLDLLIGWVLNSLRHWESPTLTNTLF